MPRNDGTGPTGMGPMTGRAAGRCNPYGQANVGLGRGQRMGRGRGFCRNISGDANEKDALLQQKAWVDQQSVQIQNRLSQIEESQKKQG